MVMSTIWMLTRIAEAFIMNANGRVLAFVAVARLITNDFKRLKLKYMNELSKETQGNEANTRPLATGYQNRISNYQLEKGEIYCICCNQVIKKIHFDRHDNSEKHNKAVMSYTNRLLSTCA